MTDYIKREDIRLIESDNNAYPEAWNESYEKGFCDAIERVLDIPSADVVEVVRCEDCTRQNTDDCFMIHGKKMNRNLFDDDYCSKGERAEA